MSIRGKISPHLSAENLPYLPGDYDEGTIPVSDENFHRYFHEVDGESLKLGGQLLMTASTVDGKKFWNFSSNEFFAANVASDGDEGYYFSEVNDSSGEPFITEGAAKARQVYDLSNGDTGFNADPRKPIRNYHFTMAMDAAFTYRGGEIFDLSGDDDVWVYIRDPRTGESVLALDLGGAHGTESGSFALDALQDFTFEEGTTYNLCLFFSERHTTGSTLSFTTSIDFQ